MNSRFSNLTIALFAMCRSVRSFISTYHQSNDKLGCNVNSKELRLKKLKPFFQRSLDSERLGPIHACLFLLEVFKGPTDLSDSAGIAHSRSEF